MNKKIKGLTFEQIQKITKEKIFKKYSNQNKRNTFHHRDLDQKTNKINNQSIIQKRKLEIEKYQKANPPKLDIQNQIKDEDLDKNIPKEITTPDWFSCKHKNIDVSIIIPLYKSSSVIENQIKNWPFFQNDKLSIEIIYVDDNCPQESHKTVLKSWQSIPIQKIPNGVGKIILNDKNCGYSRSCNVGFSYASGKYLVFLNADCVVFENWLEPMIDLLKNDNKIGIVGNMQIKNNKLDSAGSEWSWDYNTFLHIGKNSHKGKKISEPFDVESIPEDLFILEEREMVTGCCFAIPHNIFYDIGGFDKQYKVGYWEDADLCLRVRNAGYRIMYQPESKIHHEVGHTKSGSHPYKKQNSICFSNRWIETGRIDSLVKAKRQSPPVCSIKKNVNGKVIGCVIVCNEEEFLEASAESISPLVDEWIIVVGGNEYAYKSGMCDDKGYPNDNTLDIAKKIVNKYGGVVIEPPNRVWKDKIEMRNAYAQKMRPGDWMFMLDGDEIYKNNQLWRITELMKDYECLILQFWTFWNNCNTIGTGVWDKYPQERIVKWKPQYKYSESHLFLSGPQGLVSKNVPTYKGQERLFYHYSWVRPIQKIIQKREYYKHQANKSYDNYVSDIFLKWRTDPNSIQCTHPFGGGGWEEFKGIHPESIQNMINKGLLNF